MIDRQSAEKETTRWGYEAIGPNAAAAAVSKEKQYLHAQKMDHRMSSD